MTDQSTTTAPETTENTTSETQTAPEDANAPEVDENQNANREAAKYRRQLRDAETERDTIRTQLTEARAQIVSSGLPRHVNLEALAAAGHTVDGMFTDTGTFDADKLTAAIADTAARFNLVDPRLFGNVAPREGSTRGSSYQPHATDWEAAFGPDDD